MGKPIRELEAMALEIAEDEYLICPRCGEEVTVVFILSIWWNKGICLECCYKFADEHGFKVIGDDRGK